MPRRMHRSATEADDAAALARHRGPDRERTRRSLASDGSVRHHMTPTSPPVASHVTTVRHLQQTYGNQAVQRYLQKESSGASLQRDGAGVTFGPGSAPPNVLDTKAAVAKVVADEAREIAPIITWLDQNVAEVNFWAAGTQSMDALVAKVRQLASGAAAVSADRIRHAILNWARDHNVRPQPGTRASGDALRGRLEDVVNNVASGIADGVSVTLAESKGDPSAKASSFQFAIALSGATAKLKLGDTSLSVAQTYDKTVKASVEHQSFNFSAELSPDSWSLKLNIGLDPEVPDLHQVGDVFTKAQRGLTSLLTDPGKKSQGDVASVLKDTSDAVDALQGIAKAPGLSATIAAGSTAPDPGSHGGGGSGSKGWQITVTVSGTF